MKALFSQFGNLTECRVIKENGTGKSRGYAFLQFELDESGKRAVEEGHQKLELDGKQILVEIARGFDSRAPRPGGDRFGGPRGFRDGGGRDFRDGGGRDFRDRHRDSSPSGGPRGGGYGGPRGGGGGGGGHHYDGHGGRDRSPPRRGGGGDDRRDDRERYGKRQIEK